MSQAKAKNVARQAAYPERHLGAQGVCRRMNLVMDASAKASFDRLARAFALSKRQTLEQTVALVEANLLASLTPSDRERYFGGSLVVDLQTLRFDERK